MIVSESVSIIEPGLDRAAFPPLADRYGRTFDYLRIAVNETCNLRCRYCLSENGSGAKAEAPRLSADEILRVIDIAARCGVRKIRFTGGEPLLREDIPRLIEKTARIPGIESVHLTTNGQLLEKFLPALRRAGLHGLNISLDTLRARRYRWITRRDGLHRVLAGLHKALELHFASVKINVVTLRGVNDDELNDFADLTRLSPLTVRFIELMPFDDHQIWKTGRFLRAETIRGLLGLGAAGQARADASSTEHLAFRLPGHVGKIAIIPAYTRDLCASCSRIRLTADGKIRNCLFACEEHDLLTRLRDGSSDEKIAGFLAEAMLAKPRDGWEAQKSSCNADRTSARTSMTQIGG